MEDGTLKTVGREAREMLHGGKSILCLVLQVTQVSNYFQARRA